MSLQRCESFSNFFSRVMENEKIYLCFHDGHEYFEVAPGSTPEDGLNLCRWATKPTGQFKKTAAGHYKHRSIVLSPSKSK